MNSNPFQLIIPLRQHTPIIHFQHEQAGATLRATEVKPKLDKYLIKQAFQSQPAKFQKFLVGGKTGQHSALDYKLHIKSDGFKFEPIKKGDRDVPMFFANMGDDYEERGLVWNEGVELVIHSLHKDILTLIGQHIADFFLTSNFGMRNSKGFGSFTVIDSAPSLAKAYKFTVDSPDWRMVFRTIDLFYKSVRGGLNGAINPHGRYVPGFYMKPLIFEYARQEKVTWEKKIIKDKTSNFKNVVAGQSKSGINPNINKAEWPLWFSSPKERIVRDLLGLSTEQTWKGYPGGRNGASITKEDTEQNIDRFPSPIVFKPIMENRGYAVYLWANPIPEAYLNANFRIKVNQNSIGEFPIWKEFDIDYFFKEFLTVDKLKAAMQYDRHDNRQREIADILIEIYSQIENS